ncbi:MAG TPA: MerR family transcriptional regulator [Actinomycetota bacterium]|nr:MerR family transcriptional regulator [Actinomycetota bacterium]
MRYRVEQLATVCDVSVDTIRYYQARGLVPPPEREGRVAWYDQRHAERIREIRDLQAKGLTLAVIERVLGNGRTRPDADLAAAVAVARGDADPEELLSLEEFATQSGVPASLIQAVEREGIKLGRTVDGEERYTAADIEMVRGALRLLEFGLPLGELLALARDANAAMVGLATRAVELFDEYVRKPISDTADSEAAAAAQLVQAFGALLPAVTNLVANHFRRVLLAEAEERLE